MRFLKHEVEARVETNIWCDASRSLQMPYRDIMGQLRWIGVSVLVQAVVTFAARTAIEALIGNDPVASLIGAGVGILALLNALGALQPNTS